MKANAYGHGARRVARAALANGADRLSVALLDEAIELRRSNIGAPILILGSLERRRADEVVAYGLAQTISSFAEASELSKTAVQMDKQAAIHIKIDTGMGRLGFVCEKPSVINEIFSSGFLPGLIVEGIYTHFAVSDESDVSYTEWQLKKFNDICADLGRRGLHIPIRHCSNSAAISGYPEAHLNMVRPGIALYGGAGKLPGAHHREIPLRRVMSLRTEVALVKEIPAGASVGYGRRFIAGRTSRIATLPLGYGDGYGRGLSDGKGKVLIGGRRAPTAGIICMDQCMVDVTDAGDVGVGDEAVLFGTQGGEEITLEEISKTLDTIPYELMCAISRRVPRVYMQDGKPESGVNYLNY
jgi:alanine racemase